MNRLFLYICKFFNRIVRNSIWYNQSFWNGVPKFWKEKQFGLDVVNVGSGAAVHAFNYCDFDIKGRNWAIAPQSLVHDYNIIRNYFSFLREGGIVIIPICPFSCLYSNYSKKHNLKYYTFLHPATIINFDENERTRALKIKANPFLEMPLYCIKMTFLEILLRIKNLIVKPNINFQSSANSLLWGWKTQFGIEDLNQPLTYNHKMEQQNRRLILDEMIAFLTERSLIPVVVVMPMHHSLSDQLSIDFKRYYIDDFLSGIKCKVIDFMYDKDFDRDDYYSTALFFNEKGSLFFTKKVLGQIGICV